MDKDKLDLIRELLSDPETIAALKKVLLEDEPKTVKKTPKKAVTKKPPAIKKVAKKPIKKAVKKPIVKKSTKSRSKTVDKHSPEYGRSEFIDDLSEAVELIEIDKKIFTGKRDSVRARENLKPGTRTCSCGKKFKSIGSYLCDKCLSGRASNAE